MSNDVSAKPQHGRRIFLGAFRPPPEDASEEEFTAWADAVGQAMVETYLAETGEPADPKDGDGLDGSDGGTLAS
jgi:hypothetical protein